VIFLFFQFIDIPVKHENLATKAILKSLRDNASKAFSFLIGVIAVTKKVFAAVICLVVESFYLCQ